MIYIDLYVHESTYGGSAHTVLKREFPTWADALAWWEALGLRTEGDVMTRVLKQGMDDNVYVGHEIEVLDLTGGYTALGVSIEGNEGQADPVPEGCTGYRAVAGHINHDGDTCPVHENDDKQETSA